MLLPAFISDADRSVFTDAFTYIIDLRPDIILFRVIIKIICVFD